MIWYLIREIGFFLFLSLTTWGVIKNKFELLLWLYFFTFPFQNFCQYFAVTVWDPYKVVFLGMGCLMIKRPSERPTPPILRHLSYGLIILLIFSNLAGLLMPPKGMGFGTCFVRMLSQDMTYLLGLIPLYYMKWLPDNFGKKALKIYTIAIVCLITIGVIHYIFLMIGIPFSPIIRDFGMTNDVASFNFGDSLTYRIYGFCGEPKHMAFAITPFVLYMMLKIMTRKTTALDWIVLGSALFILLHTYSSAAFIEFTCGIIIVLIFATKFNQNIRIFLWAISTVLLIFLLFNPDIVTADYSSIIDKGSFVDNLYERSFGRASDELEGERGEVIALRDWSESHNFAYYLVGYGPGLYSYHSDLYFNGGLLPVQSGLVVNLLDFGLLGYVYFCHLLIWVYGIFKRIRIHTNFTALSFFIMGCAVLIGNTMYCMRGGAILIGMIPFMSISYWIMNNQTRKQVN